MQITDYIMAAAKAAHALLYVPLTPPARCPGVEVEAPSVDADPAITKGGNHQGAEQHGSGRPTGGAGEIDRRA